MYDEPRRACAVMSLDESYWQSDSSLLRLGEAALRREIPAVWSHSLIKIICHSYRRDNDSCWGLP